MLDSWLHATFVRHLLPMETTRRVLEVTMMKKFVSFRSAVAAVLTMSLLFLVGCAQLASVTDKGHRGETNEQFSRVDQHSSYPAMRRETFEEVNLLELIDPKGDSEKDGYKKDWNPGDDKGIGFGKRYDLVLTWFSRQPEADDWKRQRRNSVQDKIVAVSTSRCNVFKTYLRRQQVDVNFMLGSLTTASGILGAVLPGMNASRNLAGAAGLFSGLRSEYNQSYYSNLAAHVIVQGIDLRINRLKKELIESRKGRSVADYTMEAAISDAIVIDGNCSAVAGLIEAQESIREVENPGLKMAARAMASAGALRELSQTPYLQLMKDGSLEKLLAAAGSHVPSLQVTSTRGGDATGGMGNTLGNARDAVTRIAAQIDYRAATVESEFDRLQTKAEEQKTPKSALSGSAVRASFTAIITKAIFEPLTKAPDGSPTAVLTICVQALGTPTAALGAANATLLLSQADPAQRIDAQLALDRAKAAAVAATSRVEAIVLAATTAIDQVAIKASNDMQASYTPKDGFASMSADKFSASAKPVFDVANLSCK
jgi:hypothetical protein